MQESNIPFFLQFSTVYVHSNQQFNVTVKLEFHQQGALTAAKVGHL